ncbi:hypothetical protein VZT92_008289 [Zoarces viviparus]|uniref:Uncharacterized protein n=1 Tax=Zoarces viviparus TaxID=48416 RepID=A0AAW1FE73_ZOAVI
MEDCAALVEILSSRQAANRKAVRHKADQDQQTPNLKETEEEMETHPSSYPGHQAGPLRCSYVIEPDGCLPMMDEPRDALVLTHF